MDSFETIRDDFQFLDEWEDRYKYLIELGQKLPALQEDEYAEANKVRGCASQVWLVFDKSDTKTISFRGDSDAHIVKGLVALMIALFSGKPAQTVSQTDAEAALTELGLKAHLSPQRSNGLAAMVKRIKAEATDS